MKTDRESKARELCTEFMAVKNDRIPGWSWMSEPERFFQKYKSDFASAIELLEESELSTRTFVVAAFSLFSTPDAVMPRILSSGIMRESVVSPTRMSKAETIRTRAAMQVNLYLSRSTHVPPVVALTEDNYLTPAFRCLIAHRLGFHEIFEKYKAEAAVEKRREPDFINALNIAARHIT